MIIHLLNRRRHRVVKWAAMSFLLKATRESRGKKKLKHLLILACRALAIAALVFAVARPTISSLLGWGEGKLDTVILVLDRSASMELQADGQAASKREMILSRVKQSFEEMGNPKLILIDSASGKPIHVPSPDVLDEISQTQATDSHAHIPNLIESAINYALENQAGRCEIWVASDLQQSDWEPDNKQWTNIRAGLANLPEKANLRILALPKEANNNFSLRVHSATRDENELEVDFEITRHSEGAPQSIPLVISINGTQRSENITVEDHSKRSTLRIPISENSLSGHGYLALPADSNSRDNHGYFAYGEKRNSITAVVAPAGEARDAYLKAAAPAGFDRQKAKLFTPEQINDIPWETVSTLIWASPIPDSTNQQRLLSFIQDGGTALFFPHPSPSKSDILGTHWTDSSEAPADKYFIVNNWNHTDGPLRDGLEGDTIQVDKLRAIRRTGIQGDFTPLAVWENDSPLLTRQIHGRGSVYFFGSLPDYEWSNLEQGDVIVPLIQRLIDLGDKRFSDGLFTPVGTALKSALNHAQDISRIDGLDKGDSTNRHATAGVYQVDGRLIAANRPTSEDTPALVSSEALDNVLADTGYSLFEDTSGSKESYSHPLWQAFLIAVLLFLIAEAILCLNPKRKAIDSIH